MSSVNWKYFVVAAEELNFTKAAAKLYISQQSLSNYIVKLEAAMGMELFNRNKQLSLTAAGKSLYQNAKKILAMEELAKKEIQDIRDYKSNSIRIGISTRRGSKILPKVLPELKQLYPELRVELVEKQLKDLVKSMLEGYVDLIFCYENKELPEVVFDIYEEEHVILVIPESIWNQYIPEEKKEWLLSLKQVPLEEFKDCPFIALGEGSWVGNQVKSYCSRKNISLNTILQTASLDTMVNLAAAGYGVAVCPAIYADEEYIGGMQKEKMLRFQLDDPSFNPMGAIAYMKKRFLPKVAEDFIQIVKRNLSNYKI